ncbi:hypothetical protein KM803_03680 [Clostridium tyrobutyricum]|uniref:hypothetical protein n=1 Tax=Clostridium tyrobutyricum TaxID=1519 RepID=UPI001C389CF0|nr:hypothetical protein [Clostridium tyrobutyricum]MBV4430433.1 hypothetical protein [Clostridium tyrobutyricum]
MLLWKKMHLGEEKTRVEQDIIKWINRKKKFLNIISVPYNSTEIFIEIIQKYMKEDKKVIYITYEKPGQISIISNIKKYTNLKDYSYIKKFTNNNSNLKICSLETATKIDQKFDLIIYDDISSFSYHNRYEILDILDKLAYENSRIISYSIEEILKNADYIIIPLKNNKFPIVEPRTVITRINISKDIPFVIYDYLKWSINAGRKVIIYVPDYIKVREVSSYIRQYCKYILKNIMCFERERPDEKVISKFFNMENAVLITDYFGDLISHIENSDIMIYFADNKSFNYKEFIYLCASVARDKKNLKGEVIFLANYETKEMEKAKCIARNFNKEAWNMGLLKV